MSKQQIHILIDNSVYLGLKSKQINVSKIVNDLLKNYMDFEDKPISKEIDVIRDLEKSKSIIKAEEERFSLLSVELTRLREERAKLEEEKYNNDVAEAKAFRINNPLRWASLGGRKA